MGAQQALDEAPARATTQPTSRWGFTTSWWFPLVVGLIGTAVTFAAARGKYPGLGNDATSYLAIANHVAAGKGLGYFLEPKLGLWPPGWPLLLALPKWAFGVNPQYTGLVVNALMPIPIAYLTRALMVRLVRDPRLIAAGVVVGVLGTPVLSLMYFVQTEATFIALTLLALWAVFRFSDTHRWGWFALAAVTQWFGYMDRYVGLVLIGSIALWLLFDRGFTRVRDRVRNAVAYFAAACVVPAIWVIRNEIVVGAPFGGRDTPVATYKRNFIDAITSVGQYLHGYAEYQPAAGLIRLASVAALGAVGIGALLLLRRAVAIHHADRPAPTSATTTLAELIGHPVGLLAIYSVAHFLYMIYSASTIAFDPVNTRYLIPMFIPSVIAALVLVDRGAAPAPTTATATKTNATSMRPSWLRSAAYVTVLVFVVVQLGVSAVRMSASYWTDRALRYNSPVAVKVQHSPVFGQIPSGCRLLSNFPEFTYLAGVEAKRSPQITKFASSDRQHDLTDLERNVANGQQWCLIWVNERGSEVFQHPSYQYTLGTLGRHLDLQPIASDSGVTVYRVQPKA
jgi:hypothetical protein